MQANILVNTIIDYIEENLEKNTISIHKLVLYSGYSRRYLQYLFKKHIGISVGRYIQLRRITRAAIFLKITNVPIISISNRYNYDSQQTFSREFKKITGFSPGHYRKNSCWSFPEMTGLRYVNHFFPSLKIFERKSAYVCVEKISYYEVVPFVGKHSNPKWDKIKELFLKGKKTVRASHFFKRGVNNDRIFNIDMYLWGRKKSCCRQILIESGTFAYFSYTGCVLGYVSFINNIYMNAMAFHKLQRRPDLDIEIITSISNTEFKFEYFLPIFPPDSGRD